jgi:hypothetical protein
VTACSNPPNRPPPEVIGRLIDEAAWAKTCMLVTAATVPNSPERGREMAKLREATTKLRAAVDDILVGKKQVLPEVILVELRICEIAIPKLEAGAVLRGNAP